MAALIGLGFLFGGVKMLRDLYGRGQEDSGHVVVGTIMALVLVAIGIGAILVQINGGGSGDSHD